MHPFSTPLRASENRKGERKGALGTNGLKILTGIIHPQKQLKHLREV